MANLFGTKATLVTLAQDVGGKDASGSYIATQEQLEGYFDEVVTELAKSVKSPLMAAAQVQAVATTETYSWPDGAERILVIFHDDVHLSQTKVRELEALDRDWRDETGTPWAWTMDREDSRLFRPYPTPDTTGDALSDPYEWGASWPDDDFSVIFSEFRDSDLADWLAIFIVFKMLEREFSRLSDHQDLPYSELCASIAELAGSLAGVALKKKG